MGSPARAGIGLLRAPDDLRPDRFPRPRGDRPGDETDTGFVELVPPPARG